MNKSKLSYYFFSRGWVFFESGNMVVLIDEKDNYISFIQKELLPRINYLIENHNSISKKTLRELVKLSIL